MAARRLGRTALLEYRIDVRRPAAREVEVELLFDAVELGDLATGGAPGGGRSRGDDCSPREAAPAVDRAPGSGPERFVTGEGPGTARDAERPADGGSAHAGAEAVERTRAGGRGLEVDLYLPTWTPGSYLIREFARHVGRVTAADAADGAALPMRKVAKNRWRVDVGRADRRVRVRWKVHAHELTVRTADVTEQHAFWNHACLLLWPCGGDALRARVTVEVPAGWDVACALPREVHGETAVPIAKAAGANGAAEGANAAGAPPAASALPAAHDVRDGGADPVVPAAQAPIVFAPASMDRVMDSPLLAGRLQRLSWSVNGIAHTAVLDGLDALAPPPRLAADLQAIVASAAAIFGGQLPYARYLFLCLFTADGHGGLEHADCTTLLASRTALASDKGYPEFLSLAAHELFHAWNVKRMRPAELWRYDYERENYTEFLWLIEGWTAYYDDLLCLRAGVITRRQYLDAAARNVNAMLAAPGRFALSLRESSFDAWIRLYRPDANTRNSSQNYYGNGAVAAMCLDLWIRRSSGGSQSLDDVVRALYRGTFGEGRGYVDRDVRRAIAAAGGEGAVQFLDGLIDGPLDPDLRTLLASAAIELRITDTERPYLGVQFEAGATVVASVTAGAPASEAGVAPGDEILAVDGLRVDAARWQDVWHAVAKVGSPSVLLYARRGVIGSCRVVPRSSPGTVSLAVDANAGADAQALLARWLPEPKAAVGAANAHVATAPNPAAQ